MIYNFPARIIDENCNSQRFLERNKTDAVNGLFLPFAPTMQCPKKAITYFALAKKCV